MLRQMVFFALVLAALITPAAVGAQTGGQLWVQAFEDRNANGTQDAGEPLLTRGIGVSLLDEQGVVIASALLDNSPNAARGWVGFQFLPAGQYTVIVSSPEFTPTIDDTFVTAVSDAGEPTVLEYGAQRLAAVTEVASAGLNERTENVVRIALSIAGALVVMLAMGFFGWIVYLLTLRSALNQAIATDLRTTTGTLRAVRGDTGSYPPQ